jgi:predicted RNA-binding Zn-ribbon protein involved in translation (DUF1610 family)
MATRCANCRGYFSSDEIARSKPIMHPWPLTPAGHKVAYDNQARGVASHACPACGNHTLEG